MREPLKLYWRRPALRDLEQIAERSDADGCRVVEAMEWMAGYGWSLGHPVTFRGWPARYWPIPPYGVLYRVKGDVLYVLRVLNVRRLRRPVP